MAPEPTHGESTLGGEAPLPVAPSVTSLPRPLYTATSRTPCALPWREACPIHLRVSDPDQKQCLIPKCLCSGRLSFWGLSSTQNSFLSGAFLVAGASVGDRACPPTKEAKEETSFPRYLGLQVPLGVQQSHWPVGDYSMESRWLCHPTSHGSFLFWSSVLQPAY